MRSVYPVGVVPEARVGFDEGGLGLILLDISARYSGAVPEGRMSIPAHVRVTIMSQRAASPVDRRVRETGESLSLASPGDLRVPRAWRRRVLETTNRRVTETGDRRVPDHGAWRVRETGESPSVASPEDRRPASSSKAGEGAGDAGGEDGE